MPIMEYGDPFLRAILGIVSKGEMLKCVHSMTIQLQIERHDTVTVYHAVQGGSNGWVCGRNRAVTFRMKAI